MEFIFLSAGLALGFALGWLVIKLRSAGHDSGAKSRYDSLLLEHARAQERITLLTGDYTKVQQELDTERKKNELTTNKLTEAQTNLQNLNEKLNTQKKELEDLQKKFTTEFENIASRLLEDKAEKFTKQNKENLDTLLNPLQQKIKDFEKKVEDAYKTEAAERNSLKGEIKSLVELNRQISQEAGSLAKALKGDNKMQGNWGEVILEKILERSGLVRDREYRTQVSITDEEGKRLQPDVIVYLPDNKQIIIDAKVSLTAYELYVNSSDETEKQKMLKAHTDSVKNHIRLLSEKNYQSSTGLASPDFVLLFLPIESSFGLAIQADNDLFSYAWERKIVMVSPSTLLATLRTVSSIWKQEQQTRNAKDIAEQGAKLYDKFVGFVDDLVAVGRKMDEAKFNYTEAMKKLHEGRGNLVKSAEKLKELGLKPSKSLPQNLVERSEENQ